MDTNDTTAVTGTTLIDMGYTPAHWFGEALDHINRHDLRTEEDIREYVDGIVAALPVHLAPASAPEPYYKNLRAETEDEQDNVEKVFATMDEVMKTPTLETGAVMPDACPTGRVGQIPVGGVAVAINAIHPGMHSADVCCSVMLTNLGDAEPKAVLDAAHAVTHFGRGGRAEDDRFELPDDLAARISNNSFLATTKIVNKAKSHLGTQGDGNHFLYVGTLESTGDTVIVTHHGSRGFGASLYADAMNVAERFRRQLAPEVDARNAWIPFDTIEGKAYWEALQIVRDWTKLNHVKIHDAAAEKAGAEVRDRFWNEHNFVFRDGDRFYHAKGATPLDDKFVPDSSDGLRLIPLNMAEPILVVRGETTENNLGFAPHGAGRNKSRTAHAKSVADRTVRQVFDEETKGLDVRFYTGSIDVTELPSAYKDADTVQRQMEEFGLGKVVDRVLPYGCIMAGNAPRGRRGRGRPPSLSP